MLQGLVVCMARAGVAVGGHVSGWCWCWYTLGGWVGGWVFVRAQVGGSEVTPGGSTKVSQSVRLVAATQASSAALDGHAARAACASAASQPTHSHTHKSHPLATPGSRTPPLLHCVRLRPPPLAPPAHPPTGPPPPTNTAHCPSFSAPQQAGWVYRLPAAVHQVTLTCVSVNHQKTHHHRQTRRPHHSHDSLSAQVLEGISTSVGTLITLLGTCGGVDVCCAARRVGGKGIVRSVGEVVLGYIGARRAIKLYIN